MSNMESTEDGSIGALLRAARQRLGLTQQELGARAGLSVGALRDLEQERSRHPRPQSIRALGDVLGLTDEQQARLHALAERHRPQQAVPSGPLRIQVLGPLAVSRSGAAVPLGAGRHRVVLARLALTPNHPVSVTELAQLVWHRAQPSTAANVLQAHVSRLRRLLEDGAPADAPRRVTFNPGGYCLRAEDDEVDLLAYRTSLARWREVGTVNPQQAFDILLDALDLWRGHMPAEDVPELQDHPLVTAMCDELIEGTIRLGAVGESLHRLPELLPRLRRLAAHHPWHEGLHARLVVALAASGQQTAALQAYEVTRRRLADELGVDPGVELRNARQAVLEQRPADTKRTDPDSRRSAAPLQLPSSPPDFTGRAAELHRLEQILRAAQSRHAARAATVCVVSGMPGVGKTTLTVEAVQRVRAEFPDRPLYLDLRGSDPRPMSVAEALSQLLRALGVDGQRLPDDEVRAGALYRDVVADRQVLIVLDNARDGDHVRPLIPEHGGGTVVVTSRNECATLTGAVRLPLPLLTVAEGLELLAVGIGTNRVAADLESATAVVEACGRLPIALRMANRRLTNDPRRSARDLLEELREVAQLKPGSVGDVPAASFDLSYRQLDARSAEVFRAGSLIPGDTFSAAAVTALIGGAEDEVERTLWGLTQENLVQQIPSGRYRYHALLRAYASRRLAAEQEPAQSSAAVGRLTDWYAARTAAAMRLAYASMVRLPTDVDHLPMCFDDVDRALNWLDEEAGNLVALIEAVACGEHRHRAWQLTDQMRGYFFIRRDTVRWLASGEVGLGAAQRAGDLRAQAAMHLTLGQAHWSAGRHDRALEEYQRGVTAAAVSRWTVGEAYLMHNLGLVHATMGQVTEAHRLYERALTLGEGPEFTHIRAVTLNDLGTLCAEQGLLTEAVSHFRSALTINRCPSRRPSAMANHSNLGMVLRQLEEFGPAGRHLGTALDYHRATGSVVAQLSTLDELSHLYRQQGELSAALEAAEEALRLALRLDNPWSQAGVRVTLGFALLKTRAVMDARARFDEALGLSRDRGYVFFEAQAGVGAAEAALASGDTDTAEATAAAALQIAESRNYRVLAGDASIVLGRVAYARNDRAAACAHHRSAGESYAGSGLPGKARSLNRLGKMLEPVGEGHESAF